MTYGVLAALFAALLFGASTPLAKALVGEVSPVMLAGLLYAGSGIGLGLVLAFRALRARRQGAALTLPRGGEWAWLGGAIFFGGMLGPVLLMTGLTTTPASEGSLLLNLEGVFTALLAWTLFRENFDRRIALGMALITLGGVALVGSAGFASSALGAGLVAAACLCWAIDNNLTRQVAASDAMTIACIKGLCAGTVNIAIALAIGDKLPAGGVALAAATVGLAGYGVSLVLFVVALRELGTARTGAYFSVAPFFGALVALLWGQEPLTVQLVTAGTLMAIGVWLHVTERHLHEHAHAPLAHTHAHRHDLHHRHSHVDGDNGSEPHSHAHVHAAMVHAHHHFPDIHHRHRHK